MPTDRLYNVAGNLVWNGVDLTAGGSLPIGTSGQTIRHNGISWVANSLLYNNGTNVGIGTMTPSHKFEVKSDLAAESAPLGNELTDATGWTLGAGWSGDYATGFIHTPGSTGTLSRSVGNTGTNFYQITFTTSSPVPADYLTVVLGNSAPYDIWKGGSGATTYTAGIRSVSNGDLIFTPDTLFNATVTAISVKQITGTYLATVALDDSLDTSGLEIRSSASILKNQFIGVDSGQYNTTGFQNTAYGNGALKYNTSGFWNSATGYLALNNNTTGSRNIAMGYNSLLNNISGHRNIGIGTFSLPQNTTGDYNIGIGSDSLMLNTTGTRNVGIGHASLASNIDGYDNVAVGYNAGVSTTGSKNVFIGRNAGSTETGSNSLYIDTLVRTGDQKTQALVYGKFNPSTTSQVLTVNGKLGIGTISPGAPLDVYNTTTTAGDQTIAFFRRQRVAEDGYDGLYIKSDGAGGAGAGIIKLISAGNNSLNLGLGPTGMELYIQRVTGNVGIGIVSPNANAILDVYSTTKAFMPPRMTTAQKAAIPVPTAGMMVYDTTLNKLSVYTGAAWETVTSAP